MELYEIWERALPHAISKGNFAIVASRFIIVSFGNIYPSVMQLATAHENDSASTGIPFTESHVQVDSSGFCATAH